MTNPKRTPTVVLIAGHWLGAWAWDEVRELLEANGARAVAVTLPGLDRDDPARTSKNLTDQAAAIVDVLARLDASAGQAVTLVAHSGANAPVSVVLDRHPELVGRVVWVDSGPMASGSSFAPDLPAEVAELPLPPFDILGQQASLDGLSAAMLERFRNNAVPQPGPVLRQSVELSNGARNAVPTTLVCCSISGAQLMELARGGHPMFAEVANLESLELIDLPTGHWPMWSRPAELAEAILSAVSKQS